MWSETPERPARNGSGNAVFQGGYLYLDINHLTDTSQAAPPEPDLPLPSKEQRSIEIEMTCSNPRHYGKRSFPCNKCHFCRKRYKAAWAARILLEKSCYPVDQCWFVTLTYAPDHLPEPPHVSKDELQRFFKRCRKEVSKPFRYFAVGEYGADSARPHYHIVFFGVSRLDLPRIGRAWSKGLVHVGEVNAASARYVAHYTLKKIDNDEDHPCPEFALMSRRPGIGVPALPRMAKCYDKPNLRRMMAETGDISPHVVFEGTFYPLADLLKEKLREMLGIPTASADRLRSYRLVENPEVTEKLRTMEANARRARKEHGSI